MKTPFSDHLLFFRQFREQFKTTGAIAPSSRFLANAITEPFRHRSTPARLLEVGPGTGVFTRTIVRHLNLNERLDLVELNPKFVQRLERRFTEEQDFRAAAHQSRVHACAVQNFEADTPYDFIISGLPLNNFRADLVRQLFDSWFRLLAPGGVLSYFEYIYVRPIRRLIARRDAKTRLAALDEILSSQIDRHRFRRDWVFLNFPPRLGTTLKEGGRVNKPTHPLLITLFLGHSLSQQPACGVTMYCLLLELSTVTVMDATIAASRRAQTSLFHR